MTRRLKVILIGAGNVSFSLAPALASVPSLELIRIVSSDGKSASRLAENIKGCSGCSFMDMPSHADLYIFSVSDNSLFQLASQLPSLKGALCVHTSGSVPASVLAPLSDRFGVLYPLQTFTHGIEIDLSDVPLFIEGSSPETTNDILTLGGCLSRTVHLADSELRRRLHIAAVFGCNFLTHLLDISDTLLKADGFDLSVLSPLLRETFRKCEEIGPHNAQTGPARRGDTRVTKSHLSMLSPHLRTIYAILSDSISKSYEQN